MAGHAHTIEDTLRTYAKEYGLHTLVETGTFAGTTTEMASHIFDQVYTIELSQALCEKAKEKFIGAQNVTCLQGDSADMLATLLPQLPEDVLFFLDAHWAGDLSARGASDSPLLREVNALSGRSGTRQDLIIIDDFSFLDKQGQMAFTPGSAYFPEGGLYEWDWRGITMEAILECFPGKRSLIKDDRLVIGVRD